LEVIDIDKSTFSVLNFGEVERGGG
jgi:hypothetical protein